MTDEAPRAPLSVYMLADHLDAALAAGEDLVARGHDWKSLAEASEGDTAFAVAQRAIAEDVRSFELMLIARILKAREHARALGSLDKRFTAVANLFVSGTVLLLDAVEECGDARADDFETGDGVVAYVRARGLISPEAANVINPAQLTIDDNFLVAKRLGLGPLMDMAAAFLDALDVQYDLFVEDDYETCAKSRRAHQPCAPNSAAATACRSIEPQTRSNRHRNRINAQKIPGPPWRSRDLSFQRSAKRAYSSVNCWRERWIGATCAVMVAGDTRLALLPTP